MTSNENTNKQEYLDKDENVMMRHPVDTVKFSHDEIVQGFKKGLPLTDDSDLYVEDTQGLYGRE